MFHQRARNHQLTIVVITEVEKMIPSAARGNHSRHPGELRVEFLYPPRMIAMSRSRLLVLWHPSRMPDDGCSMVNSQNAEWGWRNAAARHG
jgi:hypothetical protein